ncbi:MAG: carboxypeptidase-like regulatory domain-containing protein [Flavobacteriaceae bacterium]|nr:carboxypeptidase-like regulatory domain-containing protein [Flavobacteriaceae bacterium]
MKKLVYIGLLLLSFAVHAQKKTYSFHFENQSLVSILNSIDKQTDYQIRYAESWFEDSPVSIDINNKTIQEVLDHLFTDTEFNYYLLDASTIIITRYKKIYDEIAEGFFQEIAIEQDEETTPIISPSLVDKSSLQQTSSQKNIIIGKQGGSASKYWLDIRGSILQRDTQVPIREAVIAVKNTNTYSQSDDQGAFQLRLSRGDYVLSISAAAYQSMEQPITVYSDGSIQLQLNEAVEALEEVVLSGNRINQINSSETGAENIDVEESKTIPLVLGERDVLKVAAALPGISSAGEGATGLNVRGGKPDQNLNLLDGGVVYNPTHFFGIFQALNPIAIGQLNIYKGSIPASYGGRLSSVFDIQTKNADLEEVHGEISLGPITFNGTVQTPIKKGRSSMLTGIRGVYSDWILKKLKDENLKNNKANFFDVVNKFHFETENDSELNITTYYSKDQFNATADSLFSYTNLMLSAGIRKNLKKNIFRLNGSFSDYRHQIDYTGNAQNGFIQDYGLSQVNLMASLSKYLHEKHRIELGNTNTLYKIQPGTLSPRTELDRIGQINLNSEQALEGALFLSDVWDLNKKFQLNAVVRIPYYLSFGPYQINEYDTNFPKSKSSIINTSTVEKGQLESSFVGTEVRLSTRYLLTERSSIKIGINNAYQFLHTLSNNTAASPFDSWRLSNRYVKPQEAQQASLGYSYRQKDNNFDLTFDLYYKKYQNLTDLKTGANTQLVPSIETQILQGDGKAYGAEMMIRKNQGDLNGWIAYTYSRSMIQLDSKFPYERINQGEYFPSNFDKPHDLSVVANYKLTRRFSFSSNFTYQSGRPITFPTGKYDLDGVTYVTYSSRNKYRIPNYIRLDLGFNVEGNHKLNKVAHSFWSVSIYNLLGRNNPYSMFFVNEDNRIRAYQVSIFARSIPSISYNLKF